MKVSLIPTRQSRCTCGQAAVARSRRWRCCRTPFGRGGRSNSTSYSELLRGAFLFEYYCDSYTGCRQLLPHFPALPHSPIPSFFNPPQPLPAILSTAITYSNTLTPIQDAALTTAITRHPTASSHCGSDCGSGAGYRFVDISSQLLDPRTGIVDTRYVRRRAEASGGLTDEPVRHARCWHSSHYAIARLVLSFAAPSLNARTRRTYTCAMSGSPRCTRRPTPQWGLISTFRLARA